MIIKYNTEIEDSYRTIIVKEKEIEYGKNILNEPVQIVCMLNDIFKMDRLAEEYCYLLCMNTKCRVIGIFEIGHGTIDYAVVSVRDVFMKALMLGATGIIIAHNHPSGNSSPSSQDMKLYENLKQASNLMNIDLFDFIIIGRNEYKSFKGENL